MLLWLFHALCCMHLSLSLEYILLIIAQILVPLIILHRVNGKMLKEKGITDYLTEKLLASSQI